jgi:hypothetical protein
LGVCPRQSLHAGAYGRGGRTPCRGWRGSVDPSPEPRPGAAY